MANPPPPPPHVQHPVGFDLSYLRSRALECRLTDDELTELTGTPTADWSTHLTPQTLSIAALIDLAHALNTSPESLLCQPDTTHKPHRRSPQLAPHAAVLHAALTETGRIHPDDLASALEWTPTRLKRAAASLTAQLHRANSPQRLIHNGMNMHLAAGPRLLTPPAAGHSAQHKTHRRGARPWGSHRRSEAAPQHSARPTREYPSRTSPSVDQPAPTSPRRATGPTSGPALRPGPHCLSGDRSLVGTRHCAALRHPYRAPHPYRVVPCTAGLAFSSVLRAPKAPGMSCVPGHPGACGNWPGHVPYRPRALNTTQTAAEYMRFREAAGNIGVATAVQISAEWPMGADQTIGW